MQRSRDAPANVQQMGNDDDLYLDLSSGGEGSVPGLEQVSRGQEVQKKVRTRPEETLSLEDELELYSYGGPDIAAIKGLSEGKTSSNPHQSAAWTMPISPSSQIWGKRLHDLY